MPQFILTDETKVVEGVTVHRVKYTRKNRLAENGELGGWVEKIENIDGGLVIEEGVVIGNAVVKNSATVRDQALIKDNAVLSGSATASGMSVVSDNAVVRGTTSLRDYVQVYDNAEVLSGHLADFTQVGGNAVLSQNQFFSNDVFIAGNAEIKSFTQSPDNNGFYRSGEFFGLIPEDFDTPARRPVYRMSDDAVDAKVIWDGRKDAARTPGIREMSRAEKVFSGINILLKWVRMDEIELVTDSGYDSSYSMLLGVKEANITDVLTEEVILDMIRVGWGVYTEDDFYEHERPFSELEDTSFAVFAII